MSAVKEHSCRLCFSFQSDKKFEVIDDFTRDILSVLSLKLKLEEGKTYLICTTCSGNLKAALEFKSVCLATGDTIYPYIDNMTELRLDLREIYKKEIENKHGLDLSGHQKVCSLCMQLVEDEFIDVCEEEVNAIHKFVPEMNINLVKDPVVCKSCLESLKIHSNFLSNCLEIDKTVVHYSDSIVLIDSDAESIDSPSKPDVKIKVKEIEFEEMLVKSEHNNIKIERKQEQRRSQETLLGSHSSAKAEAERMKPEVPQQLTICDIRDLKHPSQIQLQELKDEDPKSHESLRGTNKQTYKCDKCPFESLYKKQLGRHKRTHKPLIKCDECDYQATCGQNLRKHRARHKEENSTKIHKCNKCEYQSKISINFQRHQLRHEEGKGKQIHKCGKCSYQSTAKRNLRRHEKMHKGTQVYKCEDCGYQTTVRAYFRQHELRHKEYRGEQMYKCEKCEYQSKIRKYFYRHMWTHEH